MKNYVEAGGLNDMRNDLIAYAMSHNVSDEEDRKHIQGAVSMDLVKIGEFIDYMYSKDKIDKEMAQIVAGAAGVFQTSGFLEMGKNGRALGIRLALLRDAGEPEPTGFTWPTPDNDPEKTKKEEATDTPPVTPTP